MHPVGHVAAASASRVRTSSAARYKSPWISRQLLRVRRSDRPTADASMWASVRAADHGRGTRVRHADPRCDRTDVASVMDAIVAAVSSGELRPGCHPLHKARKMNRGRPPLCLSACFPSTPRPCTMHPRPDPDALLDRLKRDEQAASARQAEDLLRRVGRRRQDLRDARRPRGARATRAATSWWASSRPTAAGRPRRCSRASRCCRARSRTAAHARGVRPRRGARAPPAADPRRRARAHQRAGLAPPEALAGRRGAARQPASTSTPR